MIILGSILLALALVAVVGAKPWRRRPRYAHCGACRFDLTGLATEVPCPECGRGPEARSKARRRGVRVRVALMIAALALASTGVVCVVLGVGRTGWQTYTPARLLSALVVRSSGSLGDTAATELDARRSSGRLSPGDSQRFTAALMARLEDRDKPWPRSMQSSLAAARAANRLTPEQTSRYFRSAVHDVQFQIRPRTRSGGRVAISGQVGPFRAGPPESHGGPTERIAVSGNESQIEVFDPATGRWTPIVRRDQTLPENLLHLARYNWMSPALDTDADLPLGPARLRVRVDFAIVEGYSPTPIGEPWSEWYELQTTVVPADEPVVALNDDQAVGAKLAAAVCPVRIDVTPFGTLANGQRTYHVTVRALTPIPHPVTAFDILLRPSDGPNAPRLNALRIPHTTTGTGGAFAWSHSSPIHLTDPDWVEFVRAASPFSDGPNPSPPALLVDAMFVPAPRAAERNARIDSIFAGEVTYRRIPLHVYTSELTFQSFVPPSNPGTACPPNEVRVYTPAETAELHRRMLEAPAEKR